MPEERAPGAAPPAADAAGGQLTEVRELLFGAERRQLEELRRRLDTLELSADELAEQLPRAIALRTARDRALATALAPTVEHAIRESVRRNPREIATAIFPVLGPAIRKAIAEAMAGLVQSVNRAVEHGLSPRGLRWRLEAWRTGVPFAEVVLAHTLVYRVEQVFLVHAATGLPLAHVPEEHGGDASLVSGMLTAIRDFVADSFRSRDAGELRTFSVGDVCVLAEPGPQAYLAAVVRGQHGPALVLRLQRVLEEIHARWAGPLARFDGDAADLAGTLPLLHECLETVVADDARAARRGVARFAWALPAALLLVAIGLPLLLAERRWRRAVAAIEAEPGLVLVGAERDWGQWTFTGLRDPLAREPAAVLHAAGADTADVAARFAPFVSAERSFALLRARRALVPPATVRLRLAGDTLVAQGVASAAWIARAETLAPVLPGVAAVALGDVSPELPPALEGLRRDAEARRVLFAVGSAELDDGARATIAGFAAAYGRLRADAGAQGFDVALRLAGRTDASGGEAANRELSRRRVEAVRLALLPLGVATVARADALGPSDPLPAGDDAGRARLNRSVSFAIEARPSDGGR